MRKFVLPEWWQDEMAEVPANRALAEAYISRLGFPLEALRDHQRSLELPATAAVRFKRYRNQIDDKVRASSMVALRAANIVVKAVDDVLPPFSGLKPAKAIREEILQRNKYVDLDSLLDFCWRSGIVTIQLAHLPKNGKRFDGMTGFVERRPVIVLASARDGAPWLAFYVAHEIGHLALGHVGPETPPWVDENLGRSSGSDVEENEADRFACEILTGSAKPKIGNLKATGPKLATMASLYGPSQGVDPGVYSLIYAKSNDRWGVAQTALKRMELDTGGRAKVSRCLEDRLQQTDLSEAEERFLGVGFRKQEPLLGPPTSRQHWT